MSMPVAGRPPPHGIRGKSEPLCQLQGMHPRCSKRLTCGGSGRGSRHLLPPRALACRQSAPRSCVHHSEARQQPGR